MAITTKYSIMSEIDSKIPILLQGILWIIPINIYVIGNWLGAGIQWLFFRYQQTYLGNSFFLFNKEIQWILLSVISGRSLFSIVIWAAGIILLAAGTFLIIFAYIKENPVYVRYAAFLNISGAGAFSVSIINLYGFTLTNPAGIAIPFGIPVILAIAYWQYKWVPPCLDDEEADRELIIS